MWKCPQVVGYLSVKLEKQVETGLMALGSIEFPEVAERQRVGLVGWLQPCQPGL